VEVEHLVPGLERVVGRVRAPARAGVVDQDVDVAEGGDRGIDQAVDRLGPGDVGGEGLGADVALAKLRQRSVEFGVLARGDHHAGTVIAQRLRDLQAKPARPAGDEDDTAIEVEQGPLGRHAYLLQNHSSRMASAVSSLSASRSSHVSTRGSSQPMKWRAAWRLPRAKSSSRSSSASTWSSQTQATATWPKASR